MFDTDATSVIQFISHIHIMELVIVHSKKI